MRPLTKTTALLRREIAGIEEEIKKLAEHRELLRQQGEALNEQLEQHREALGILIRSASPMAREE